MIDCIIVNPTTYDKLTAYKNAVKYCNKFLQINGLPKPSKYLTGLPWYVIPQKGVAYYGWYQTRTREIFVDVDRSHCPVTKPGFIWSYTGFKTDLTIPGTMAHEVGHHVQTIYEEVITIKERKAFHKILNKLSQVEKKVSSYEPNVHEMFAEAMRLFLLNPDLLQKARPLRYELLTEVVGLKPVHKVAWQEILRHAHPEIFKATQAWIGTARVIRAKD